MSRAHLEAALRALWFDPKPSPGRRAVGLLLAPLGLLAARHAGRQRRAIQALPPPPVPVLVVGNLVVGGAGKTPLVAAIAAALQARGWRPGILARGHQARQSQARLVRADDDVRDTGDEPLLLARLTGLPVAAGLRRAEALAALLAAHPEVDVVVSDDGLQHAALPRSVELAVFDARGAGNGRLLPGGPLREPLAHLAGMDAIVVNRTDAAAEPAGAASEQPSGLPPESSPGLPAGLPAAAGSLPRFAFRLQADRFEQLAGDRRQLAPAAFRALVATACPPTDDRPCLAAVAGIGAPERFFATLRALGLPDPLRVTPGDHRSLPADALRALDARFVVMTGKDAVKCRDWADDRCWALQVFAQLDPALADWLDNALREARLGRTPARHPGMPDLQGAAEARTRRHGG